MRLTSGRKLVALALISSVPALIGLTHRAQAQDWACSAYEHKDFRGKHFGLAADGSARKSHIANQISSFKMVRGCHVEAYTDDNFRGAHHRWRSDVSFVGSDWNDAISSWKCVCGN